MLELLLTAAALARPNVCVFPPGAPPACGSPPTATIGSGPPPPLASSGGGPPPVPIGPQPPPPSTGCCPPTSSSGSTGWGVAVGLGGAPTIHAGETADFYASTGTLTSLCYQVGTSRVGCAQSRADWWHLTVRRGETQYVTIRFGGKIYARAVYRDGELVT
jgi:hypothetical protein